MSRPLAYRGRGAAPIAGDIATATIADRPDGAGIAIGLPAAAQTPAAQVRRLADGSHLIELELAGAAEAAAVLAALTAALTMQRGGDEP